MQTEWNVFVADRRATGSAAGCGVSEHYKNPTLSPVRIGGNQRLVDACCRTLSLCLPFFSYLNTTRYPPFEHLASLNLRENPLTNRTTHRTTTTMYAKQTTRLFSTALRAANKAAAKETASPVYGSFKTFAEYREFIVQKDPEHLAARVRIMISNGKPEQCPETEAENSRFADDAKKVAYNV